MRFQIFFYLVFILLLNSCGPDKSREGESVVPRENPTRLPNRPERLPPGPGPQTRPETQPPRTEPLPQPNEEVPTENTSVDGYATDIKEVDLLDVAMDVAIELMDNKIVFKQSKTDLAQGDHSVCSIGVSADEAYGYKLDGSTLSVRTSSGELINFQRVSGDKESILGGWASKSYRGKQLIMRRITFLSTDRMVMRAHCES